MDYSTSRITDNDYKDIHYLIKHSFGVNLLSTSISNKYDTSMFGMSNVGLFALDAEKKPVAYYGVFPIVLNYDSSDYLIAQSGDTMTIPDHRKKGLFTKLAKETYSLSEEVGIRLIYGFPNENSYPGFKKKLNWFFPSYLQKFTIDVITVPFCELASKFTSLEPAYKRFFKSRVAKYQIGLADLNIDDFSFSKVKGKIKRDESFFKYKLRGENTALVRINGFSLLIKSGPHLYIGEVNKIDESQTQDLIESVKTLAKRLGCKKAIFLLTKNHWLHDYLDQKVKPTKSQPIGFYIIDEKIKPEQIQFSVADFDTF